MKVEVKLPMQTFVLFVTLKPKDECATRQKIVCIEGYTVKVGFKSFMHGHFDFAETNDSCHRNQPTNSLPMYCTKI